MMHIRAVQDSAQLNDVTSSSSLIRRGRSPRHPRAVRPPARPVSADALGLARVREELWACGYGGEGLFWRGGE